MYHITFVKNLSTEFLFSCRKFLSSPRDTNTLSYCICLLICLAKASWIWGDNKNILFIGSGGAVKGVLDPLIDCSPRSIFIYSRNIEKAKIIVSNAGDKRVLIYKKTNSNAVKFDLIINSTPASLYGEIPQMPDIEFDNNAIFYDMSYGSEPTPFQEYGISKGCHSVDGLGMLVEQAGFSFFQWHGKHPETREVLDTLRL